MWFLDYCRMFIVKCLTINTVKKNAIDIVIFWVKPTSYFWQSNILVLMSSRKKINPVLILIPASVEITMKLRYDQLMITARILFGSHIWLQLFAVISFSYDSGNEKKSNGNPMDMGKEICTGYEGKEQAKWWWQNWLVGRL